MRVLLYVLAVCYLLGLLVIVINTDYRIETNLETNSEFYPAVDAEE